MQEQARPPEDLRPDQLRHVLRGPPAAAVPQQRELDLEGMEVEADAEVDDRGGEGDEVERDHVPVLLRVLEEDLVDDRYPRSVASPGRLVELPVGQLDGLEGRRSAEKAADVTVEARGQDELIVHQIPPLVGFVPPYLAEVAFEQFQAVHGVVEFVPKPLRGIKKAVLLPNVFFVVFDSVDDKIVEDSRTQEDEDPSLFFDQVLEGRVHEIVPRLHLAQQPIFDIVVQRTKMRSEHAERNGFPPGGKRSTVFRCDQENDKLGRKLLAEATDVVQNLLEGRSHETSVVNVDAPAVRSAGDA
mmetsp:Transcript_22918/g.54197  ORF Transcript_22918/g.54197 Transcript_22918/m.54197 type:complete len:300 (-) Transcript_22918:447-1346(-)